MPDEYEETVEKVQHPWGDEPWSVWFDRQRRKAAELETERDALERRLAAHEKLIRKVRVFLESGVEWPTDALFEKADQLVCEMIDALEENDAH